VRAYLDVKCSYDLPGGFKHSQQSGTSQNTDAQRWHNAGVSEDFFNDTADDDERIKPIEHGDKVTLKTDAVHFDEHFKSEQSNKEQIGDFCNGQTKYTIAIRYITMHFTEHLLILRHLCKLVQNHCQNYD
jgi:hypothetical protein